MVSVESKEEAMEAMRTKVVNGLLIEAFKAKQAPSRAWIVDQIKHREPKLDNPRLDLQVGVYLNHLVDEGTLQRTEGRWYAPGKQYCKETDSCDRP